MFRILETIGKLAVAGLAVAIAGPIALFVTSAVGAIIAANLVPGLIGAVIGAGAVGLMGA